MEITWVQFQQMTAKDTKKMYAIVNKMIAHPERKNTKTYSGWMENFKALATKIGENPQDFIEYYNL